MQQGGVRTGCSTPLDAPSVHGSRSKLPTRATCRPGLSACAAGPAGRGAVLRPVPAAAPAPPPHAEGHPHFSKPLFQFQDPDDALTWESGPLPAERRGPRRVVSGAGPRCPGGTSAWEVFSSVPPPKV